MDRRVTDRALLVFDLCLVMKARSLRRQFFFNAGVALEAELTDACTLKHLWIARSVRRVACRAAFCLHRTVLEDERALLVRVALDAGSIGTIRKLSLLRLKTAVGVVTVAARHCALGHLVVKRLCEL